MTNAIRARVVVVVVGPLLVAGCASEPDDAVVPVVAAAAALSQTCSRVSGAYVPWPMTVCDRDPIGGGPIATAARFVSPFCHQKSGPWSATIVEEPSCLDVHVSRFTFTIDGAPQKVAITWDGALTDAPPPIDLHWFVSWTAGACQCCPGFRACPGGGCRPFRVSCGGATF